MTWKVEGLGMTQIGEVAAACLLAISSLAAPASPSFTLEQVLSAPFPSDLVAAPSGGAVAWVFNAKGVRNIWAAEAPDYRGRAVTAYAEDDGEEITDLEFTPDGKSLLFVRGGDANRKGEHPNPSSRPEGTSQTVYVVALAGGAPRKIADGESPVVSPKGDRVALIVKDQVWFAPLAGDEKPARAFAARGDAGHLRWSPDGSRLAFVSRRGDHSFVGIYDPAGKSVTYLDPSTDWDNDPVWSPDGKRVLFLRVPASRALQTFRPHREGEPWSMRFADAATGKGKEVFRAAAGRGSVFRNIVADDQFFWADGDRLVFPWERDGWTHLYAIPASGGDPRLLTPGEFEVEYASLSSDRKRILYNSNQDDVDRRHLWSVAVAGGRPSALTTGDGIEWRPVETSNGKALVFLRSGARRPPAPAVELRGSAARELAPGTIPSEFPQAALVEPRGILFPASDGLTIHGQLFLPAGAKPGERFPAMLFFHGGSRRQMLLGWHYNYYYRNSYAFNQYLASRGYAVLSVNYRSGIGYGMEFREALDYGASGASEFRDVEGAGLYMRGRADVRPDRIGLWGGSYGGYLTALGLARASSLFAAGVDLHGVHDWNGVISNFEPTYAPQKHPDAARLAFESSPLASVKSWRSPVLLIHGDDDRNVPFAQSVELAEALRAQGVELEELVFPDEIHDFLQHRRWLEAYRAAADFLDRHLRAEGPKSTAPSPK
jgi:dipeptidyl aminopeptidase/acylaminoacyl peptidase